MNRLAGPWLMELDDTQAVSPVEAEGECWDRLVAQLQAACEPLPAADLQPPLNIFCRRQVTADLERLAAQLLGEVDRLLEQLDPALGSAARESGTWTKVQRASLLAHASGALVERSDAPGAERA